MCSPDAIFAAVCCMKKHNVSARNNAAILYSLHTTFVCAASNFQYTFFSCKCIESVQFYSESTMQHRAKASLLCFPKQTLSTLWPFVFVLWKVYRIPLLVMFWVLTMKKDKEQLLFRNKVLYLPDTKEHNCKCFFVLFYFVCVVFVLVVVTCGSYTNYKMWQFCNI